MARASARARHGSYLFQRSGSLNWYIKLRSDGKRVEKSLHTADKLEAEIAAQSLITQHKAALLAARPRLETVWQHKLEPGRKHVAPDGGEILATDKELFFVGHDGSITRTEPNGSPGHRLVGAAPLTPRSLADAFIGEFGERPKVQAKNSDDQLFETYLKQKIVTGYFEREARSVWALYKTLTDGKPLKDATRDDGRKLVEYFEGQKLKSATIRKKLAWPTAAVNLAIKEGRLRFNPFSSVVPDRGDKQKRLPLDEADMKNAKRSLDRLDKGDQVLFRLLATTGMRLSEAFEIEGELKERGCRYVIVGAKTEQSERRVPFPMAVLPYLPQSIKGPLFEGGAPAASKRLNRFLNNCGIADARKVVHSLRHRAQDRLRAAGCPEDVRWAILGHEERTVAAGYGEGFPVPLLKQWIDKIGF